jgi:hypothetical protein
VSRQQPLSCVCGDNGAKGQDMNEYETDLEKADEDILTYSASP